MNSQVKKILVQDNEAMKKASICKWAEIECLESSELAIDSVQISGDKMVQLNELYPYGAGKLHVYAPQAL